MASLAPSRTPAQAPRSLRYVDCRAHGIHRVRRARATGGFGYVDHSGKPVSDPDTLARIRALVVPPAWTDVWICPHADGHIQATGVDARGRKQYRYHAQWTAHRNQSKFDALAAFARALPRIRRRVREHLALPGMPREKVLACVVHLMDITHIRVGNEEYARANHSYGLTTIRNHHASVRGADIRLRFKAKSGKECDIRLHDAGAAAVVRRCQDLPGQELFAYVDDDGGVHDVTSCDVNDYLREIAGASDIAITAKTFRTWAGTIVAAETLAPLGPPGSPSAAKRAEVAAVKAAAAALYNTVATCRKFYVHPEVARWWAEGTLGRVLYGSRAHRTKELDRMEGAIAGLLEGAARRKKAA